VPCNSPVAACAAGNTGCTCHIIIQ
jgi:hypothetical protein